MPPLPPHLELADTLAECLPGVCTDSAPAEWLRKPSEKAGITRQHYGRDERGALPDALVSGSTT